MEIKIFSDRNKPAYNTQYHESTKVLFSEKDIITPKYSSDLSKPVRLSLCGSAGEGVQLASELLAKAAVLAGLHVTKKSNYPVTVGIGFSNAEIIISPVPVFYTGSPNPDYMIFCSQDGLDYGKETALRMSKGTVFIDTSLPEIHCSAEIIRTDFRTKFGGGNAAIFSVFYLISKTGIFPIGALMDAYSESKVSAKLSAEKIVSSLG